MHGFINISCFIPTNSKKKKKIKFSVIFPVFKARKKRAYVYSNNWSLANWNPNWFFHAREIIFFLIKDEIYQGQRLYVTINWHHI